MIRTLFALPLAALAALALPAAAQTHEDEQLWLNLTVQGALPHRLLYLVELQPRFADGASRLDQLFLPRIALGVPITRRLSLYQGYAHIVLPVAGGRDGAENRSFQQIGWALGRPGGGELSSRTRIEQRWRSEAGGMQVRLREMVRYAVPFSGRKGDAAALVSMEGFAILDGADWDRRTGFDQLRSFIGLELPVRGRSTLEIGYLNQSIDRPGRAIRMNHVASLSLFVRP